MTITDERTQVRSAPRLSCCFAAVRTLHQRHHLIASASLLAALGCILGGASAAYFWHSIPGAVLFFAAFVLNAHNVLAEIRLGSRVSAGRERAL